MTRDEEEAPPEDVIEPVPETEDDPAPPASRRRPRRRLWLGIAVLATVIAALGAWLYFGMWKYEPTALRHVPEGANIVIRAEAAKLLLFKPVRTHLWPVLLEQAEGRSEKDHRITRIAEETGLRIPTDLREAVVASIDGTAWIALVGGKVEPGRFVTGLQKVLVEEGISSWKMDGDLLVHDAGAIIAQADDGTIIIGSHREIVEAAIPATESDATLPVPSEDAIGFRMSHSAFKHVLKAIPDSIPAESLHSIDEISGTVLLSEEPHLTLEVLPLATTPPAQLAGALSSMFSKLGLVLLLVPHDLYGAKSAISDARVSATEETVRVDAQWPYEPLDKAVQLLARALEGSKPSAEP